MNIPRLIGTALVVAATYTSVDAATKAVSDLTPPQKRQATVDTAERLAQRKAPAPLPADLTSPFNPPDFDKADPSDPTNAPRPTPSTAGQGTPPAPTAPVAPPTARETLETLAAQITPSGMIQMRGAPRLIIGNKPFEVGTRFTATYNNQDYDLELVAIDRTTFTLRYRSEEITRPIKPVR
jgi:hypothetical protein